MQIARFFKCSQQFVSFPLVGRLDSLSTSTSVTPQVRTLRGANNNFTPLMPRTIRAADRSRVLSSPQTVGHGAGDASIDEDARQRNLSVLNVIIRLGDISSSRPERSGTRTIT